MVTVAYYDKTMDSWAWENQAYVQELNSPFITGYYSYTYVHMFTQNRCIKASTEAVGLLMGLNKVKWACNC